MKKTKPKFLFLSDCKSISDVMELSSILSSMTDEEYSKLTTCKYDEDRLRYRSMIISDCNMIIKLYDDIFKKGLGLSLDEIRLLNYLRNGRIGITRKILRIARLDFEALQSMSDAMTNGV